MVFRRKDLCDARPKPEMSSYFHMKCTLRWDVPPVVTSGGLEQNEVIFSEEVYPQMRCTEPYYARSVWPPPPPSIELSGTEPYYTRSVWPPPPPSIEPSGTEAYYTRPVWPPPLPQSSLVVQSPIMPGQFDPLCLSKLNLVVQSPTTPGQFDMWKHADIFRSDILHP